MKWKDKFPKKIAVFGKNYKIKFAELAHMGAEACVQHERSLILIDSTLKRSRAILALMHEIGHCVFFRSGLHQTSISDEIEEIIVENISVAIFETLKVGFKNDPNRKNGIPPIPVEPDKK